MTRDEEELIRQFSERSNADHLFDQLHHTGTIYGVVQALCSVALKAESIKRASAPTQSDQSARKD